MLFLKDKRGDSINTVPCERNMYLNTGKSISFNKAMVHSMVQSNFLNLYTMRLDFRWLATYVGLESV